MKRVITLAALAALGLALSACGEKPQAVSAAKKSHTPAYEGTTDGYSAGSWKAGDQASWTEQIHTRNQSQNEYNRTPPAAPAK
jgi:predicted small lipoprotein YifL